MVSFQCVLRCPLTAADMEKHSFTFICNSLTHCTACNSLCVMWGRRADVFIYCGRHVPLICIHFIQICSVHLLVEKPNMYSKILTQQQKCWDTNQFSSDDQKIIACSCRYSDDWSVQWHDNLVLNWFIWESVDRSKSLLQGLTGQRQTW